ncbi:MAG: helix-turn-helix domain-containing protein [Sphingomonadales bacterium]
MHNDHDYQQFLETDFRPLIRTLGENIRYFRRLANLSRGDVALAARFTPNHMARIEDGEHVPTLEELVLIARALAIPLTALTAVDGVHWNQGVYWRGPSPLRP